MDSSLDSEVDTDGDGLAVSSCEKEELGLEDDVRVGSSDSDIDDECDKECSCDNEWLNDIDAETSWVGVSEFPHTVLVRLREELLDRLSSCEREGPVAVLDNDEDEDSVTECSRDGETDRDAEPKFVGLIDAEASRLKLDENDIGVLSDTLCSSDGDRVPVNSCDEENEGLSEPVEDFSIVSSSVREGLAGLAVWVVSLLGVNETVNAGDRVCNVWTGEGSAKTRRRTRKLRIVGRQECREALEQPVEDIPYCFFFFFVSSWFGNRAPTVEKRGSGEK